MIVDSPHLVAISTTHLAVYHGRTRIALFELGEGELDAEQVEQVRTDNHTEKTEK